MVGVCLKGLPKTKTSNRTNTTNTIDTHVVPIEKGTKEYRPKTHNLLVTKNDNVAPKKLAVAVKNTPDVGMISGLNNSKTHQTHRDISPRKSMEPLVIQRLAQSGQIDTPHSIEQTSSPRIVSLVSTDVIDKTHKDSTSSLTVGNTDSIPDSHHQTSSQLENPIQPSGLITTPTKNKFDTLETESELHVAFRNLQRSDLP